jgi:hypothetical protein
MTRALTPPPSELNGKTGRFRPPVPRSGDVVEAGQPAALRDTEVRIGRVSVGSAAGYLLAWAGAVLAVWVIVCCASYWVLLHTGALASVSRSAASILDARVEPNGLLAVFTWPNALAAFGLSGALLALAWFVTGMGAVLVHNTLVTLHSPRVHLKH